MVRLVVVGDGPRALGREEHRLVGFCLIGGGDAGYRRRGHGLAALDVAHGGRRQLGKALRVSLRGRRGELTDRSGDAHARSDRWNLAVLPRVDKQSVRTRASLIPRAARAGGLDRVAVQRRTQAGLGGRVRGGHNAKRRHGGPHHRGIIPRTHGLNIRDRRIDEAWAGVARLRGALRSGGLRRLRSTRLGLLSASLRGSRLSQRGSRLRCVRASRLLDLRGSRLACFHRTRLARISRPSGGHKPDRGQRERAKYS